MDIQSLFAKNVRAHRKAAHLSQEKLAERAGLHRTYIGGIEQRRVNVSLKNIGKIANALGVDPAILFLENDLSESTTHSPWQKSLPAAAAQTGNGSLAQRRRYASVRMQPDAPLSLADAGEGIASLDASVAASIKEPRDNVALCIWDDNGVLFRPIETSYDDLTVHILNDLIAQGYTGEDLYRQYIIAFQEISDFLER